MGTVMYPHVQGGTRVWDDDQGGLDGCSRDPSATTAGAVCMIAMLSTGLSRSQQRVAAAADRDARSQRSAAQRDGAKRKACVRACRVPCCL